MKSIRFTLTGTQGSSKKKEELTPWGILLIALVALIFGFICEYGINSWIDKLGP